MKEEEKSMPAAEIGAVLEGKVVRIMPFGVFVETAKKKSGLVHISEISKDYIKDISDHVRIGDSVMVIVLGIDEKGKMSLSIKQAAEEAARRQKEKRELKREKKKAAARAEASRIIRPADVDFFGGGMELSFEDKLSRFKQDSDEKMLALKRSAESKRSGGYSRKSGR